MTKIESWVHPGAEVASVCLGQHKSVTYSRINRIGKQWLFLDNEEKFHVLGLDRAEGPLVGGRTYRLFPADHPKVKEIELDIEVRRIMAEATRACRLFIEDPSVANAERVVLAVLPYTSYVLESTHEKDSNSP